MKTGRLMVLLCLVFVFPLGCEKTAPTLPSKDEAAKTPPLKAQMGGGDSLVAPYAK